MRSGLMFHLHGAWRSWRTNCKIFFCRWSEVSRRWGWAWAHWICPMRHGIWWRKRFHSYHLRISSPRGNRKIVPPQTFPYPLWPVSLVYHLLVWPVQYTIYTWSWDQASEGQWYKCISCEPNWNNHCQKWSLCVQTPLKYTAQGSLPDFWSTSNTGPDIDTLVGPMLKWSHFPSILVFQRIRCSCNSFSNSVMITRSFAYRFSHGHPVRNS